MGLLFKHRIEIVEEQVNPGPYPGTSLQVVARPWADIQTMQGKEVQVFKSEGHEITTRFIIRYMKGLNESMKINYKGREYDIESLINDNEDNYTITIIAKANV